MVTFSRGPMRLAKAPDRVASPSARKLLRVLRSVQKYMAKQARRTFVVNAFRAAQIPISSIFITASYPVCRFPSFSACLDEISVLAFQLICPL
jgi:hypothetical protein